MKQQNRSGPKVVAIGGGTGLPIVINALSKFDCQLKVIVSVADDGYSSGRLRRELGILPPGDIRNCLLAMSNSSNGFVDIFNYRFDQGSLSGHSLGNLIIAALSLKSGDFAQAVKKVGIMLGCWGEVLPSTLEDIILVAETENGSIIEGQFNIATGHHRLSKIYLKPEGASAYPEAIQSIIEADIIIIGPGSVYTSILPNLLINDIKEALNDTSARRIYFCNLMTQPGETDNLDAKAHLDIINQYTFPELVDDFVVNSGKFNHQKLDNYYKNNYFPVKFDKESFNDCELNLHLCDLVDENNLAHHSPLKIRTLMESILANGFFN